MRIDIPGYGALELDHLVCDFNGTLAEDGRLLPGVAEALNRLARSLTVHVITADTHGSAERETAAVDCALTIIGHEDQNRDKRDFVRRLGASSVAALGNGRNDEDMLREAGLGVALIQREGAFSRAVLAADVICPTILDALALLEKPDRLIATLRNR